MKGASREQVEDVLGTCFPTAIQPNAECREPGAVTPALRTSQSIKEALKSAVSAQTRRGYDRGNVGALEAQRKVPLLAGKWSERSSLRASWRK